MRRRLTHLARALDEWVREGTIEPKGLCQAQIHLRHIVMACDGTLPSSSSSNNGHNHMGSKGGGGGGGTAAPAGKKAAPAPPPPKKGAGEQAALSKVPTVERAVAEGMAYLGKLDAHKWFAKPVVEVWPNFKVRGTCGTWGLAFVLSGAPPHRPLHGD